MAKDYKKLYFEEVAAHRENVHLLLVEQERRLKAEATLRSISESFMMLHNLAKDVVGPKIKVLPEAQHPARLAATQREMLGLGIED